MKKIILAGGAITAEILTSYLKHDSRYQVTACTVDDEFAATTHLEGVPIISMSRLRAAFPTGDFEILMAMGYHDLNRSRSSLFGRLKEMGYTMTTYIHPEARVHTQHSLGEGTIVLPSAVIEPQARVGANTLVWCNTTLAHHSSVADHCWIASGAVVSGHANVERNSFVGVNATIVNKITVREFNVIGAGALITKDTKPNSVHLARSAEELRYSSQDYVKYFGV